MSPRKKTSKSSKLTETTNNNRDIQKSDDSSVFSEKQVKGLPPDDFQTATFSPTAMAQISGGNSLIFPDPPKPSDTAFQVTFDESNQYYHVLNQIIDPEVAIGIADMGIIYEAKEKNGVMSIVMTLTSMGCPAGPQITTDIDEVMRQQPGISDVEIEVVWDPPWTPDRIKPELRMMMFGY